MDERSSLRGQAAIVTGAGEGIGAAVAERFAAGGARVALVDKETDAGSRAAEKISSSGADALFFRADVTQGPEVSAAFSGVLEAWGRIDVLVNCAGGFIENPLLEDLDSAEWQKIIDWNLKSVYLCIREAARPMKEAGYGRIVNVSSQTGREGLAETALAYGSAKAGILGLTRRLAIELAPHGITVNAVAPGLTLSPRVAEIHRHRMDELVALVPVGFAAEPEDIADGIWYLATPGARYVNGVTLDINGGRYMP